MGGGAIHRNDVPHSLAQPTPRRSPAVAATASVWPYVIPARARMRSWRHLSFFIRTCGAGCAGWSGLL